MKIAQELLTLKVNSSQLNDGDITQLLFILLRIHSGLDSSMSDEAEREEIREETHELEDSEQDELEENDDDYDEDEADQNR
jgi:hypothetical protein